MKQNIFPAILAIVMFFLIASTVSAENLQTGLDQKFALSKGQTATLVIGQPEVDAGYYYNITLQELAINPSCLDAIINGTDTCLQNYLPIVLLKIKETPGYYGPENEFF